MFFLKTTIINFIIASPKNRLNWLYRPMQGKSTEKLRKSNKVRKKYLLLKQHPFLFLFHYCSILTLPLPEQN